MLSHVYKWFYECSTIAEGATEPIETAIFKDSYPQVKQLHGVLILGFFVGGTIGRRLNHGG